MSNPPSSSNKPPVDEMDWYAIACKIRSQNKKLQQKINNLENIIDEQQEVIKMQGVQNQEFSDIIDEHEQIKSELESELDEYEEQIIQKDQQIETQQGTISQCIQELEKIQQQTARLERECSLLQENYNEEQNKLKQLEAENKDLRIRLQRQQRYNLQYKTALDKFLDTSSSHSRENHGLGIKSWSESGSENNNIDIDDDDDNSFGLSDPANVWNAESSLDSKIQINQTESFASNSIESNDPPSSSGETQEDSESHQIEAKEDDHHTEDKKNKNKLFIKLPDFGLKKKNEK